MYTYYFKNIYCRAVNKKENLIVFVSVLEALSPVWYYCYHKKVVYNACTVLSSHNAFDHRRWIFTFTHHLTRRWQLRLATSHATNPDALMLLQPSDSKLKKGCSKSFYVVSLVILSLHKTFFLQSLSVQARWNLSSFDLCLQRDMWVIKNTPRDNHISTAMKEKKNSSAKNIKIKKEVCLWRLER